MNRKLRPYSEASAAEALNAARDWVLGNEAEFLRVTDEDLAATILLVKPFAELVLTGRVMIAVNRDTHLWRKTLDRAWERLGGGDRLADLLVARPDLITLSCVYSDFHGCGYRSARLDWAIRAFGAATSNRRLELPLWRKIDVQYSMWRLGIDSFPAHLIDKTWLASLPEPWFIANEMAYAATHVVFYATDFGRVPAGIPDDVRGYLELWLPAWIRIYAEEKNWDLTAEFSMVADCLDLELAVDPIPSLLEHQHERGYVPGPKTSGDALVRPGDTQDRVLMLKHYHTTLVAMMALAMRLNRSDLPTGLGVAGGAGRGDLPQGSA